ncbi:MAG: PilW family protein [Pseudomonadales bacterium]|nr:PilW family protein [Pseudomonadales bacterium]
MMNLISKNTMKKSQQGITVIELMIASAIGLFLTVGVITLFIDSKRNDYAGVALAEIQESARIAMEMIAKDVRMAGFQGCADINSINLNIIADDAPTANFGLTALRGYEVDNGNWANGEEFDNEDIENRAVVGSDVIAIQRAISGDTVVRPDSVSNANVKVNNNNFGFAQNDAVLISNCENADLFRITSNPDSGTWAHAQNVNSSNRLGTIYGDGAIVYRFSSTAYFVADTGRDDAQGNAIFALYRQTDNLALGGGDFDIEELVEGVESLQILYGERLATNNIRYVPADTVGLNMGNVVSIKIGLLVASNEVVRDNTDNQVYALPGEDIGPASDAGNVTHPDDNRLRKAFTLAVGIRNRS